MAPSKRKWQSMDSAIADMSSEESISMDCNNTANNLQQENEANSESEKQCRRSYTTELGFDARDFGTAASQRPRRRAATQTPTHATAPQEPPQKRGRMHRVNRNQSQGMPALKTSRDGNEETPSQSPAAEVKGNSPAREQTLERYQAATGFPSPPQTHEKTSIEVPSQTPRRRPVRERRPTGRVLDPSVEEETPCKKASRKRTVNSIVVEAAKAPPAQDRKTCIVCLRVPSISTAQQSSGSMFFTGSFSNRKEVGSPQNSQSSERQDSSLPVNQSFQHQASEAFAQPQPEPILLDSHDLYSSQSVPDVEDTTSHAAAHLKEHLQANSSLTKERFRSSLWTSKHEEFPPTSPTSAASPQQEGDATAVNDSWQTQATLPWCPPSGSVDPGPEQHITASTSFHASQATTIDETPVRPNPSSLTLSKQELNEIASRICASRSFGQPKPEPVGQPSVWADARMDLCETLHYFRSYQGACHSTGGFVRGFMFDKVAHPRDYTDSNVVIARAGGGQVRDKESGEMKASGDQVEGIVSQNLRNCILHYNPVVIITGIDNPHMPSQPPHQYCVLDHFKPTHIWTEKSGNSKIVRYRFEKLNAHKDAWWRAKDVEDPVELGSLPPPFGKACGTCARESLQIYLNGWMCLQPTCGSFWLIFPSSTDYLHCSEPYEPDEASLIYDPRFLKSHTPWPNDSHVYPLTSNDAVTSSHSVPGENTSEAFTRGVVCPCCGRCVPRLSWAGWECTCGWTRQPAHTLIPALSIREPLWPLSDAYTASRDTHSPLVGVRVDFAHGYRINTYTLPGIDGFVTHMIANAAVVAEPEGPDDIFEELQRQDIGLRRRPMEGAMLKGGMYTRHFCVNYGMPYKFIAATESHPFPASPHPITTARSRLDWAAREVLSRLPRTSPSPSSSISTETTDTSPISTTGSKPRLTDYKAHPFNEVLALSYFESQRISYHDDGEFGLGPTIATLSLGAPGTMRLRLKAKHHLGVSSAGVYTDAAPLPGCIAYEQRLALHSELHELKRRVSPGEYRKRLKEVPRELRLKRSGNARDAVTLRLGHGDVVVMHGEAVQRYFEHAVEHAGKLRFALTTRYIDPGSLGEGERPMYGVEGYGGNYDGAVGEGR